MIWYMRLIGITFGGLTIDKHGKMFVHPYVKYFGYATIGGLLIDQVVFAWLETSTNPAVWRQKYPGIIKVLFLLLTLMHRYQKLGHFMDLNVHGYKLVDTFVTRLGGYITTRGHYHLAHSGCIWNVSDEYVLVYSGFIYSFVKQPSLYKILVICDVYNSVLFIWVICIIQYITSIYCCELLDNMLSEILNENGNRYVQGELKIVGH